LGQVGVAPPLIARALDDCFVADADFAPDVGLSSRQAVPSLFTIQ
jgi:hypothetical protein